MDFWISNYCEYADKIDLVCEKNGDKYQIRNQADDAILYVGTDDDYKLKNHVGHKIKMADYGTELQTHNYAIECMDCYEVLFSTSFDESTLEIQT